jgi:ArsR family transcriptional regulator
VEKKAAIGALGALAQETRLDLFRLLVTVGPQGLPAGVIAERLGVLPASLSFHLAQLVHAGLITQRRLGRQLIYSAEYGTMNGLCSPTSPRIAAAKAPRARRPAIPPPPSPQERAMKRFHVHVSVDDLAQSIRFYSTLFRGRTKRGEARLCQVDAGGPAGQFCDQHR